MPRKKAVKKIQGQVRQGDVLIEEVPMIDLSIAVEETRDEHGRIVLAYGESTGHAHTIHDPHIKILNVNGARYLYDPNPELKRDFTLRHELVGGQPTGDHGWITRKPASTGLYRVGGKSGAQREYQPDSIRNIAD